MVYPLYFLSLLHLAENTMVLADCSCGYALTNGAEPEDVMVFTDALESDFTKLKDLTAEYGWQRQEFNVSAEAGRGKYGKAFSTQNVVAVSKSGQTGYTTRKENQGVDLVVGSNLSDGSVPVAEMDTVRKDIAWGSFRAGMRLTNVRGTCAALFWYFNDTQEIDMEFLSREYDHTQNIYPVNLVIQSRESAAQGYDASKTNAYKKVNLTFDPTESFHEYRFDYLPGRVSFYADSTLLADVEGDFIPDSAGHIILQHWSNGNPKWSGGPPTENAIVTVSYFKAYFNSSDFSRQKEWAKQCENAKTSYCTVPNVTEVNATTGGAFLTNTTDDNGDKTSGTTPSSKYHLSLLSLVLLYIQIRVLVKGAGN